jgi:endonuclease YncB( thermonuclease family)
MLIERGEMKVGITPATLLRTIDGDTFEVQVRPTAPELDLGFGVTLKAGTNTPIWLKAKVRLVALTSPYLILRDEFGAIRGANGMLRNFLCDTRAYRKIDTPEIRGPSREAGLYAKDAANSLVEGKDLLLITPEKPKSFDRWIGAILYRGEKSSTVNLAPADSFFWHDLGSKLVSLGQADTSL